jgi:hypothetical protein
MWVAELYLDKSVLMGYDDGKLCLGWGHTSARSTSVATHVLYDGRC